jgi:hypothetical protein
MLVENSSYWVAVEQSSRPGQLLFLRAAIWDGCFGLLLIVAVSLGGGHVVSISSHYKVWVARFELLKPKAYTRIGQVYERLSTLSRVSSVR